MFDTDYRLVVKRGSGNVGSGTTSPDGKLEIRSGLEGDEDVALRITDFNNDAATYAFKIEDKNTQADIFRLRSDAGRDYPAISSWPTK